MLCADVVMLATAYGVQNSSTKGALAPYEVVPPERLRTAKSIALIGSGLTMVDALIGARRDGFSGIATIVSRRGQLPRRHAAKGVVPLEVAVPQSKSVARLTAAIRIRWRGGLGARHALASGDQRLAAVHTETLARSLDAGTTPLLASCAAVLGRASPSPAKRDA